MTYAEPLEKTNFTINIAEDDYDEYVSSTEYTTGDYIIVTLEEDEVTPLPQKDRKVYRSSADTNTGNYPPANPEKWTDYGAINAYKVIDKYVNTQSERDENILMTFDCSKASLVALFGVVAASATVTLKDSDDVVIFTETVDLLTRNVVSWTTYYFDEFEQQSDLVVPIPFTVGGTLEISLDSDGLVKVGAVGHGLEKNLGVTLRDPGIGILDYSKKDTDSNFGNTYLSQGKFSKYANMQVMVCNNLTDMVNKRLASIRGKACIFIGNNSGTSGVICNTNTYESLIIYGFYRDYDMMISGTTHTDLSISIEGLI